MTQPAEAQGPDIFQYLDYRGFLADWFSYRKTIDPDFSLRVFSRSPVLELSSSSFISAVLKGRKNLSQALRLRFGRALKLKPAELDYFDALVRANQSKSREEKAHFLAQLNRHHSPPAHTLAEEEHRYYSRWYYSVVWHYFGMRQDRNNPALIARAIHPALTAQQVEEAIRVLLELKLIKRLANGFAVTHRHLAAGPFKGEVARRHNLAFMELARMGLESAAPDARQYNVMTFSVSARGFERLRERINAFRGELRELAGADEGEDRVYALALQLFPCASELEGEVKGKAQALQGTSSDTGNPEP
jgi:uncharacterized protein (TIGR02147 family)